MKANPSPSRQRTLPPEIQQLLAQEQDRRGANWLDLVPPLCGVPSTPITPRHILELTLAGNPLFTGHGLAHRRHVFDVLWRLHPGFSRPGGPRRLTRAWRRWWLKRRVWRLDVTTAAAEIRQRLLDTYLDAPAAAADDERSSPLAAVPFWLDSLIEYVAGRYGAAFGDPRDMPLTQLFQLRRAAGLQAGEDIIDPVAEAFHRLVLPRRS